jgi:hypothetical protein
MYDKMIKFSNHLKDNSKFYYLIGAINAFALFCLNVSNHTFVQEPQPTLLVFISILILMLTLVFYFCVKHTILEGIIEWVGCLHCDRAKELFVTMILMAILYLLPWIFAFFINVEELTKFLTNG